MLYLNCVLTIVIAFSIDKSYCVIANKSKYEIVKPLSTITSLPDEKRPINFKESPDETSNKRENSENESDKNKDSRQEKKIRTLPGPLIAESGDNVHCCGSRYELSSSGRSKSIQGGNGGSSFKGSSDNGRYSSGYGSHPEDRFGWQSYTPGTSGRRGSIGNAGGSGLGLGGSGEGLYGSHSGGDRYGGSRPSYYSGENEYNRPSTNGNRPGRPNYGYGSNNYGDNGAYGSNGYETSRPGGYGGGRPHGGINFGGGRPGGGSYGSGTYGGGGGHGVYGTIGEENEFPGQEDGSDGGSPHPGVNNLQTQKAVALKALAGVALIGAAAALATNPILLPIGVLAGRRKRSVHLSYRMKDIDVDELMKLLKDKFPEINGEKIRKEILDSPVCVARLACEIEHEYLVERNKKNTGNGKRINVYNSLKRQLANLIQSQILRSDVHHKTIKNLIKTAKSYDDNCNVFLCNFIKH